MITFEGRLSGTEIGDKLSDDEEELAYCLIQLEASTKPGDLTEELSGYLNEEEQEAVVLWLEDLTAALRKAQT